MSQGNSYEELRDGASGEGGEAWRQADREERRLRELYRELKDDPRYTQEHKAEKSWDAYERAAPKITANKERAKEHLRKAAKTSERFSIPVPPGESLVTGDADKLIASQNHAASVVRRVERAERRAKGPLKPDAVAILREEYARGLEVGGVEGGAVCRGVLVAARELGVDRHAVVDPFRKERHRESLAEAEHRERLVGLIGGTVPEPPFARAGREQRGKPWEGGPPRAVLVPRERAPLPDAAPRGLPGHKKDRRPPWK